MRLPFTKHSSASSTLGMFTTITFCWSVLLLGIFTWIRYQANPLLCAGYPCSFQHFVTSISPHEESSMSRLAQVMSSPILKSALLIVILSDTAAAQSRSCALACNPTKVISATINSFFIVFLRGPQVRFYVLEQPEPHYEPHQRMLIFTKIVYFLIISKQFSFLRNKPTASDIKLQAQRESTSQCSL